MTETRSTDTAAFVISVAASLAGMHPQTLRSYDRLGLVSPRRTPGGGRRYTAPDIDRLREVQRLSQEEGVNLAGIKRIISLGTQVDGLQHRVAELLGELADVKAAAAGATAAVHASYRRELVPVSQRPLLVWRPLRTESR